MALLCCVPLEGYTAAVAGLLLTLCQLTLPLQACTMDGRMMMMLPLGAEKVEDAKALGEREGETRVDTPRVIGAAKA